MSIWSEMRPLDFYNHRYRSVRYSLGRDKKRKVGELVEFRAYSLRGRSRAQALRNRKHRLIVILRVSCYRW